MWVLGAEANYIGKMVFDDEVLELMKNGYAFLHRINVLKTGDMPENAYNEEPLLTALEELGLEAPIGRVVGE